MMTTVTATPARRSTAVRMRAETAAILSFFQKMLDFCVLVWYNTACMTVKVIAIFKEVGQWPTLNPQKSALR